MHPSPKHLVLLFSGLMSSLLGEAGTPQAPRLEFIFEEVVTLSPRVEVGDTPMGKRGFIPITGGRFEGPNIRGQVLPGGWDWQLATDGGCFLIEADYMIQTDDGVIINIDNRGRFCQRADGVAERGLTSPVFEAPLGKYDWLNAGAYVGTLESAGKAPGEAVRIRFYKAVQASP